MNYDIRAIVTSIENAMKDMGLSDEKAHDIAFHMTDWLEDLSTLQDFYNSPDNFSPDEVSEILMGFLIHVPNHVAAASKLMIDIPVTDVFGVGATGEN